MIHHAMLMRISCLYHKEEFELLPLEIAIIGAGVSGLSAAWLLSQRHHVTLIEADSRLGGHANTVPVRLRDGRTLPVDTGFIVSNSWTYPNFTAMMDYLDVEMTDTAMSFSVATADGRFEYSGHHLGTLMGRARQWLKPSQWRLISDLLRFYKTAEAHAANLPHGITLGQYLDRFKYSPAFIRNHILPIAGAIWSAGPEVIAGYPLHAFVSFFANHKLFALGSRPNWRTVRGGSGDYVSRLCQDSRFETLLGQPVHTIRRTGFGVELAGPRNFHRRFQHVVIATHADQALRLLGDPTVDEMRLLSPFKSSSNRAILHRDETFMPRSRRFWSAWNYHAVEQPRDTVSVTYWMNALQNLDSNEQHFVSLNPAREPDATKIDGVFDYRHPVFTAATHAAQQELWNLQGVNHTWFAGAWFGAGFHEDGLQAGLAVAEQLGGVRRPWNVADESGRIFLGGTSAQVDEGLAQAAE